MRRHRVGTAITVATLCVTVGLLGGCGKAKKAAVSNDQTTETSIAIDTSGAGDVNTATTLANASDTSQLDSSLAALQSDASQIDNTLTTTEGVQQ